MKSISEMTPEEVRRIVRGAATAFAAYEYGERHPGCSEEEAWSWAVDHWEEFAETAIDGIAVISYCQEIQAHPWN